MPQRLIYDNQGVSFYVDEDHVADFLAITPEDDTPWKQRAPFVLEDPISPEERAKAHAARRHAMMLKQLRPKVDGSGRLIAEPKIPNEERLEQVCAAYEDLDVERYRPLLWNPDDYDEE